MSDGVHNMSRSEYDALDRVNWSSLKRIGDSPAHYRHAMTYRDDGDTDAMCLGRCVHLGVFEPERFRSSVARWDGKVRNGSAWKTFESENAGREILTRGQWERCVALIEAVRGSDAKKYLEGGKAEASLLWTHTTKAIGDFPAESVQCKGRVDFISSAGVMVDLKTTPDASPEAFGRTAWKMEYHAQAAFYVDGYEAITGKRLPYVLVAVEKDAPYVSQSYRVTDEQLELGRERYLALLSLLGFCRRESRWGGYSDGETDLVFPRWATPNDEDDVGGLDLVFGDAA